VLTGKESPRTGSVGVLGATGGHGLAKVAIYSPMRPRVAMASRHHIILRRARARARGGARGGGGRRGPAA
jgi:hypothetical protein